MTLGASGFYSIGSGGTVDGYNDFCLNLRYIPGKTVVMYAMVNRLANETGNIETYNFVTGVWDDEAAYSGTYSDYCLALVEKVSAWVSGNYSACQSNFRYGDNLTVLEGELQIEYWMGAGGSANRTTDTIVGTQTGFWSDEWGRFFTSRAEKETYAATHLVQTGNDSNVAVHTDQAACCERIAFIEDIARDIHTRVASGRGKG
jgi:hypothetical protein